jgi:hypothetical protein
MHNYLLMGHILQCKVLEKDEIHPELWVGSGKKWRTVKYERVERQRVNKVLCQFDSVSPYSHSNRPETNGGAARESRAQTTGSSRREEAQISGDGY